ncbi:DUF4123 domain-containing protein [Pseudomonas sp. NPDC089734]|uniref:DUF4123 domain-containing protein n=1 Tax=Pseudomonas sp. NPDC089734 TaxID=3364469 RepID=UPI00380B9263
MSTGIHQANYLLIDGALHPHAIRYLQQRGEPLEIDPLYLGTSLAPIMEQGPILVHAPVGTSLIDEWQQTPARHEHAIFLTSQAPLQTVARHLRHFIKPPDHLGNTSLLRFADPVVSHFWLSSYGQKHLNTLLGPINDAWVKAPVHQWQASPEEPVTRFTRTAPPEDWNDRFALLGEPQLAAFEQAYQWLFMRQIHAWLTEQHPQRFAAHSAEQVQNWLERVLDTGQAWGLISEYAFVTWADICHTWGLDFMERADSPYQHWLALFPEQKHLPPELRIEALDDYCHTTLNATDATHDG